MLVFHDTLTEIVAQIEIDLNFVVRHPEYPPLELQPDIIARFQRIPPQLQTKYLTIQVQNYLYDLYFSHSLASLQDIEATAQQPPQIKNNLIDGIDIDFYQRLQQSNTSQGYIDPNWQIVAETDTGESIVMKDGLNLHIDRQQHLPKDFNQAAIGDIVPIYLPHNLVDRDTYIMVGNVGMPNSATSNGLLSHTAIELYFNFTPDAAVAIAQTLTHELNKLSIPFQFAILHNPALFHRYDAGTLWLSQADYLATQTLLAEIYQTHQADFSPDVPLFTKQLAPGLGIAEISTSPGSFGMQRCELLAMGLLAAMDRGQTLAADKLNTIRQQFATAGIDGLKPHLNPDALDCYKIYISA
ncbi:MAG: hypothetical protein RLZZ135_2077 [Cyanobacteriota bacterium]|jgi:hypothetical protein